MSAQSITIALLTYSPCDRYLVLTTLLLTVLASGRVVNGKKEKRSDQKEPVKYHYPKSSATGPGRKAVAGGVQNAAFAKGEQVEEDIAVAGSVVTRGGCRDPIEFHWQNILNCFSLTDNFRVVWASPKKASSIPIIDGIRCVGGIGRGE